MKESDGTNDLVHGNENNETVNVNLPMPFHLHPSLLTSGPRDRAVTQDRETSQLCLTWKLTRRTTALDVRLQS